MQIPKPIKTTMIRITKSKSLMNFIEITTISPIKTTSFILLINIQFNADYDQ